jgi:hypothetical protein
VSAGLDELTAGPGLGAVVTDAATEDVAAGDVAIEGAAVGDTATEGAVVGVGSPCVPLDM